jgi:hypothetical protein
MKGRVLGGLCLAAVLLSLGLAGCGGGIEEGMPAPDQKGVPLDPKMVDMSGWSFKKQGKKKATAKAAAAKQAETAAPAEKKE